MSSYRPSSTYAPSSPSTYYYYIDPSVDAKCRQATGQPFSVYFQRAQQQARAALTRLSDPRDTDFARVFNVIMKTPRGDRTRLPRAGAWQRIRCGGLQPGASWQTTAEHVARDLSVFAQNFRPAPSRAAAHVRFYADGRRRWTELRGGGGVRFDPVNHLLHKGNWGALRYGQAFRTGLRPDWAVPRDENPERWVIDFSDAYWGTVQDEMAFVRSCRGDLSRVPINDLLVSSLTRLIFHETMHAPPLYLDDIPFNGETSMWEVVMASKKSEAHRNAESMAVLGTWAWLADQKPAGFRTGGYTLDRSWGRIPGSFDDVKNDFDDDDLEEEERMDGVTIGGSSSQKWVRFRGNNAVSGIMMPYRDLTRQNI